DIGQGFSATMGTGSASSNNVLFTIILPEPEHRHRTSSEIASDLRQKLATYQKGKISVQELSGGPPAGADLQIKLSGADLQALGTYASKIEDYLKTQEGVTNVDRSIKPGTSKITFVPDQTKM